MQSYTRFQRLQMGDCRSVRVNAQRDMINLTRLFITLGNGAVRGAC